MKYIKIYEIFSNFFAEYSVGDIVIVRIKLWSTTIRKKKDYHAIFVIKHIIEGEGLSPEPERKYTYQCYQFDIDNPDINDYFYFKEEDIVEKISKEKAELLLTSQKYNL